MTLIKNKIIIECSFTFLDRETFFLSDRITSIMNIFSHNLVSNFVESACWPDDVKKFGLKSLDEWHFIDLPVRYPEVAERLAKSNITYKNDDALGTLVKIKFKFIFLFSSASML